MNNSSENSKPGRLSRIIKSGTVLLSALLLIGCAGETAPAPVLPGEGDGLTASGYTDMEEYKCKILQGDSADSTGMVISDANPFGYEGSGVFAELALARLAEIEEKTKADVSLVTTSASGNKIISDIAAGDTPGEIYFSASTNTSTAIAKANGFADMASFDCLDITDTEKYGDANILEVNTYKGLTYIVTPMKWPFKQPRVISVFMFDNKLVSQFNLPDMRQHLENKTWNWDALEEMMNLYTVNDGDRKYSAIATRITDFGRLTVFGNGVRTLRRDSSGTPVTDLDSAAALQAFDWLNYSMKKYPDAVYYNYADWQALVDGFSINRDGIAALIPTSMVYTEFSYSVDDFFLMPFPTGPSAVYGEWPGYIEGSEGFAVFEQSDVPEYAAEVVSMLCDPFEGYETTDDLRNYLSTNVLFNDSDADILLNLHKNAYYSYWAQSGTFYLAGYFSLGGLKNMAPSEYMASKIDEQWTFMNEYMVPNLVVYDRLGK